MKSIDDLGSNSFTLIIIAGAVIVGLSPVLADEVLLNKQKSSFKTGAEVIQTSPSEDNLSVGVNLGKEGMYFGEMPWNVTVDRSFNLSTSGTALVQVKSSGNISKYLNYTETLYIHEGRKELEVTMMPEKPGYYSGDITVKTQVAKNEMGRKWLNIKRQFY